MPPLTSEPHAQPLTLSYAKANWHRRLPHKTIVLATILISTALATMIWGGRVRDQIALLYWQSRCLRHSPQIGVPLSLEWRRFCELFAPPGSTGLPLYIHGRVSRAGNHRLVVLEALNRPTETQLVARVIVPGGLFSRPREVAGRGGSLVLPAGRVLEAQSDASDSAHFTFSVDINSRRHVIDGWLQDDDTVKLEPRDPL